jgi:hypothetical protein
VINRNTTMKLLTLPALVVLSLSMAACGGRDAEPIEPAGAGDTAAIDTPTATMPTDSTGATMPTDSTGAMPPATTAGACEGLTGQALTDCLNQAGPTTGPNETPTTNEAGMTDDTGADVPLPENADATTPPQS